MLYISGGRGLFVFFVENGAGVDLGLFVSACKLMVNRYQLYGKSMACLCHVRVTLDTDSIYIRVKFDIGSLLGRVGCVAVWNVFFRRVGQ